MAKSKTIKIGTTSRGTRMTLPMDIVGRRTLVVGMSGSGKSNTATVIMEQLIAAGEQLVMIDPKGEGWGLRSNVDGSPSNLDVILFGEPNGDIEPLDETHGPRIADFVVQSGRSVVLSMLGFESDQAERRFAASFMRQLYRRKSKQANPTRLLIVIDEAHLFVPERPSGEQADLAGAIQRIARQGRSKGIGTLLIDQRPQDVAKRVITQCETIICHQLAHKLDRAALKDWVRAYDREGQGETFLDSLAALQPGEGWVWSPAWLGIFERVQANLRSTFDAGAAPSGSKAARVQRAAVDLDKLRGDLADVIEQAEADDPTKLRTRIAELEKQVHRLEKALAERPVEAQVERVEIPAVKEADVKRIEKASADLNQSLEQVMRSLEAGKITACAHRIDGIAETLRTLTEQCDVGNERNGDPHHGRGAISPATRSTHGRTPRREAGGVPAASDRRRIKEVRGGPKSDAVDHASGLDELKPAHHRIIDAIAWLESFGIRQPQRSIAAAIAGASPKSSSYLNNVSRLSSLGLVSYPQKGLLELTEDGRSIAKWPQQVPTLDALHKAWRRCKALKPANVKLLDVLIEVHPNSLTREELAEAAGASPTSSSYLNNVSRLSSLGLAEYPQQGHVRATSLLFPEGLA